LAGAVDEKSWRGATAGDDRSRPDRRLFFSAAPLESAPRFSTSLLAAPGARCRVPAAGARPNRAPEGSGAPDPCCSVEDMAMRTFDPTPFWRSTVGFDRLFDMLDQSARLAGEDSYPPYNIERTGEDHYRISLALAGFSPDQVTITAEQNVLTVEGAKPQKAEHEYLYQGIATRPFRRVFNLADHVQVKSASFDYGLLMIELEREVPEAMKPRRIAINGVTPPSLERKKAA
jgi:molecular chaperone IbpA